MHTMLQLTKSLDATAQ